MRLPEPAAIAQKTDVLVSDDKRCALIPSAVEPWFGDVVLAADSRATVVGTGSNMVLLDSPLPSGHATLHTTATSLDQLAASYMQTLQPAWGVQPDVDLSVWRRWTDAAKLRYQPTQCTLTPWTVDSWHATHR